MPTIIDSKKLAIAILAKRKKVAKRKLYIHVKTQYTPSDFSSQRYQVIVSNYFKPTMRKPIIIFGDLLENEVVSTASRLIDQFSIPYSQVFINLTDKPDQQFALGE